MKNFLFLTCLLLLLPVPPAWGHGTEGSVSTDSGTLITAAYDDGEPMSYAEVVITGPDSTIPFQKGRTDRNGSFMFRPDCPGSWAVVVSDGMGHRLALAHQEKGGGKADPGDVRKGPAAPLQPSMVKPPKIWGITAGISIIFGLCSCLWAWKTRQRLKDR